MNSWRVAPSASLGVLLAHAVSNEMSVDSTPRTASIDWTKFRAMWVCLSSMILQKSVAQIMEVNGCGHISNSFYICRSKIPLVRPLKLGGWAIRLQNHRTFPDLSQVYRLYPMIFVLSQIGPHRLRLQFKENLLSKWCYTIRRDSSHSGSEPKTTTPQWGSCYTSPSCRNAILVDRL